jgi:hypothetical protein
MATWCAWPIANANIILTRVFENGSEEGGGGWDLVLSCFNRGVIFLASLILKGRGADDDPDKTSVFMGYAGWCHLLRGSR